MTILRVQPTASNINSWIRDAALAINQIASTAEAGVSDGDKGDIVVTATGATWSFDSSVVSAFARTILDDTTASGVRGTIGAQADDATLTALAGLNATAGLVEQTGADTFTKRAMGVASSTDVLTRADGDGRYSLTSHTHTGVYQPLDTQLTDLAALSYTGNASKVVAVKADESALELVSAGVAITVKDEGSNLTTAMASMDFVGAGVVATNTGGAVTVTISGVSYTDEQAQDAVGAMVDSSLVYVDATPLLQRAALTGDVTASAGSNATTIANDVVTYAKMQNVSAASKLLGRGAAGGSGDTEEISLGTALSMSGTTLNASGAAWVLAGTGQTATGVYDFAVDGAKVNIDFIGLASFNQLLIIARGLSDGTTGTRVLRVSVDNGSTFFSASGDYVLIDAAGVETSSTAFAGHDTNSTAARSFVANVVNMKGAAKLAQINRSVIQNLFVASASDINAIRVTNSGGGNITAGTVRVYAR